MKKKALLLIALLLVVGGLVSVTYAWLTDTGNGTVEYTVGDVSYEITAPGEKTPVVPGQQLLLDDELVITNKSNVATHLRVKIEAADIGLSYYQILTASGWEANSDGYYYYGTKEAPTSITATTDANGVAIARPITSIILDGAVVGNAMSNQTGTITFIFEVKQADHVTWAQMEGIDFTTGLAG